MSKAVMISIRPQWVEKIANKEKAIEVRRIAPKLETPFKVYIYCTNGQMLYDLKDETYLNTDRRYALGETKSNRTQYSYPPFVNRKVIGEFVCEKVDEYTYSHYEADYRVTHTELDKMCLNYPDLIEYGKGDKLRGLHISQLKIYDKPKELGEFRRSEWEFYNTDGGRFARQRFYNLTRPPQSWCYVEESENERV